MAISQVGSATTATGTTSAAPTVPTGTTTDDIVLAVIATNDQTLTVPSGFVLFDNTLTGVMRNHIYTKVATSSEGSSYTFSITSASIINVGITTWRGCDTTTPLLGAVTSSATNDAEPRTGPNLATTGRVRMLHMRQCRVASATPITYTASGPAELFDFGGTSGSTSYSQCLYADAADITVDGTQSGLGITANAAESHNVSRTMAMAGLAPTTPVGRCLIVDWAARDRAAFW